jgi:hypothetical protein
MADELWHYVEARRDDGTPTMFRIRELDRRPELPTIFVVELPYPTTELSRLPGVVAHRRLAELEEGWLRPACQALGWELVGMKTEDGSFFVYMYGHGDPQALIERLAPFDGALGFYDDADPAWAEYATLRELLDQAKAMPPATSLDEVPATVAKPTPSKKPKSTSSKKPKPKPKPRKKQRPAAKAPRPRSRSTKKRVTRSKRK